MYISQTFIDNYAVVLIVLAVLLILIGMLLIVTLLGRFRTQTIKAFIEGKKAGWDMCEKVMLERARKAKIAVADLIPKD